MKKILIVEDDREIRENVREILEINHFQIFTASNGQTGLHLARTKSPDLIICDVMMPDLTGFQVLEELRSSEETASLPVIFLTAKVERNDQRQGMNLGADDYLTKPFKAEELVQAITARLARYEVATRQYYDEIIRSEQLGKKILDNQELIEFNNALLQKLIQDLRDPLSNINMAIFMLKESATEEERNRYITILQEECTREMTLLNEVSNLQELLTPSKINILRRFNLLKKTNDE